MTITILPVTIQETLESSASSSLSHNMTSSKTPNDCQGHMRHPRPRAAAIVFLLMGLSIFACTSSPTWVFRQGSTPPSSSSRLLPTLSRTVVSKNFNETNVSTNEGHSMDGSSEHPNHQPSQHQDHRPLAILHFGPRKTATTTIQYVLNNNITKHYLQNQDHFTYYGKGGKKSYLEHGAREYLRDCVVFGSRRECATKAPDWLAFVTDVQETRAQLEDSYNNNPNRSSRGGIVISDEALSQIAAHEEPLQLIKDAFAGYEIRIVVTYRHHYEWLLSEYNQEYKGYKQGNRIRSLVDWYHQKQYVARRESFPPLTKDSVTRWNSVFDEVRVFDMHGGQGSTDLIQRFICEMIPEAQHTCHAAQHGSEVTTTTTLMTMPLTAPLDHQQKSVASIEAEYVAYKTFQKLGLLQPPPEVQEEGINKIPMGFTSIDGNGYDDDGPSVAMLDRFAAQVQSFLVKEQQSSSFPRQCLKPFELEAMLQKTLEIEGGLFLPNDGPHHIATTVDSFTATNHKSISTAFQKVVDAGKYCNVDLKRLQDLPSWQTFVNQKLGVHKAKASLKQNI